jgi:hypothetical protein
MSEVPKEILETINNYYDGVRNCDLNLAKKSMSLWATMSLYENGKINTVPIQVFYDWVLNSGPQESSYKILNFIKNDKTALINLQSHYGKGGDPITSFGLVKSDEGWKIVSKLVSDK